MSKEQEKVQNEIDDFDNCPPKMTAGLKTEYTALFKAKSSTLTTEMGKLSQIIQGKSAAALNAVHLKSMLEKSKEARSDFKKLKKLYTAKVHGE